MRRTYPLDPDAARWLVAQRKAAGLTQNELALLVGVSESTIAKLETLRVPLGSEMRAAIQRALSDAGSPQKCMGAAS